MKIRAAGNFLRRDYLLCGNAPTRDVIQTRRGKSPSGYRSGFLTLLLIVVHIQNQIIDPDEFLHPDGHGLLGFLAEVDRLAGGGE